MTAHQEIASRKYKMEQTLAAVCGMPVELTIRGERSFTVSAEGCQTEAVAKLGRYFGAAAVVTVEYDADCDLTCAYIEIA